MSLARASVAVPVVPPAAALQAEGAVFVDLRSPGEFAEDHLPDAVNVPLFDDAERALIGTLYARRSPAEAFAAASQRARERIGELTRAVAELAGWSPPSIGRGGLEACFDELAERGIAGLELDLAPARAEALPRAPVVLGCWRGGLRSRSVVAYLRGLGLERAVALEGGYRAYRRHVRARLAAWSAPPSFVLRGLTGVGKTLVLRELERQRPGWTLDLEGLAGHRSSILGMVGLEPVSQKTFEGRLERRLARGFAGPCVVEGESRKVGDVVLPARVWDAIQSGTAIELVAPLERRIEVLVEDYLGREDNRAAIAAQLPFIEERLGRRRWTGRLVALLEARRERELVEILLERYYDPLYRHSEGGRSYAATVDASDVVRAAGEVADWIGGRPR